MRWREDRERHDQTRDMLTRLRINNHSYDLIWKTYVAHSISLYHVRKSVSWKSKYIG